jgi:hypothetical protein
MTRITRGDIGNSDHRQKCEKLFNRKIVEQDRNVQSATKSSQTTAISCQTTGIPKRWEERGETTTQTISEQRIGGATGKRDQPESTIDGPSAVPLF